MVAGTMSIHQSFHQFNITVFFQSTSFFYLVNPFISVVLIYQPIKNLLEYFSILVFFWFTSILCTQISRYQRSRCVSIVSFIVFFIVKMSLRTFFFGEGSDPLLSTPVCVTTHNRKVVKIELIFDTYVIIQLHNIFG